MRYRELIPPARVRVLMPFTGAFRKVEAEYAAAWLAQYSIERHPGSWDPVPRSDLVAWLRGCLSRPGFAEHLGNPAVDLVHGFATLARLGFVAVTPTSFEVGDEFVLRCFVSGHRLRRPLAAVAAGLAASALPFESLPRPRRCYALLTSREHGEQDQLGGSGRDVQPPRTGCFR